MLLRRVEDDRRIDAEEPRDQRERDGAQADAAADPHAHAAPVFDVDAIALAPELHV